MGVLLVPTIKSDDVGYRRLFSLIDEIRSSPSEVYRLDFRHCSALDINAMAALGLATRYISAYGRLYSKMHNGSVGVGRVDFDVGTMSGHLRKTVEENNFLRHVYYGDHHKLLSASYIGYREHGLPLDEDGVVKHLRDHWLTDDRLDLSKLLKQEIISRILEIYVNAYGHGKSDEFGLDPFLGLGAISCGEYDAKQKLLKLCVVDFGKGICKSVREYISGDGMNDEDALAWALQLGNSTRTDSVGFNIPRGLGFDLLRQFVLVNDGCIRIYSNNARAVADGSGGYLVSKTKSAFDGTIVEIAIKCDGRSYRFAGENASAPQEFF